MAEGLAVADAGKAVCKASTAAAAKKTGAAFRRESV
jgi:hypothetical protein